MRAFLGLFVLGAWLVTTLAFGCPDPRQMDGFKTCADVAKAEQEGSVVVYSTDPEDGSEPYSVASFRKSAQAMSGSRLAHCTPN